MNKLHFYKFPNSKIKQHHTSQAMFNLFLIYSKILYTILKIIVKIPFNRLSGKQGNIKKSNRENKYSPLNI